MGFSLLPTCCFALSLAQHHYLAASAGTCGTRRPRELIIKQNRVIMPCATAVPHINLPHNRKTILCNQRNLFRMSSFSSAGELLSLHLTGRVMHLVSIKVGSFGKTDENYTEPQGTDFL